MAVDHIPTQVNNAGSNPAHRTTYTFVQKSITLSFEADFTLVIGSTFNWATVTPDATPAQVQPSKRDIAVGSYLPSRLGLHHLPEIKQIHVGVCFDWGSLQRAVARPPHGFLWRAALAHAHEENGKSTGQVCFRDGRYIVTDGGEPSEVLMHEYAHVLTDSNHGLAWSMQMREWGLVARTGIELSDEEFYRLMRMRP